MDRAICLFKPACVALAAFVMLATVLAASTNAHAGTTSFVTFSAYTNLSGNAELARRMLSPLTAAKLPQILAAAHETISAQPIDLAHERFALFVPSSEPPRGYGLIVFVPPWNEARVPDEWQPVLDQAGTIFVSAGHSGNDTTALGRREPLALLAEQNVARLYHVDPDRIFVAGFSGGARIAMRLALGYPDVFRGAILNSGGDPIGDSTVPLPPRDLFHRFQSASKLVYLTGEQDTFVINAAMASAHAMREWCQFNVENRTMPGKGHELIDASSLSRALDELAAPPDADADKLSQCRAGIESELDEKLRNAAQLIASGRRDEAQSLLTGIDAHYGGLAAPRILELQAQLAGK